MLLWWRSASLLLRHPLPPWLPSSSYLQLLVYFSPFPLYESFFEAIDINKQTAILAWHDVLRVACCRWGSILPTWFALRELRAQASERVQANRQRRAVSVAFPLAPLSRSLAHRSLDRSQLSSLSRICGFTACMLHLSLVPRTLASLQRGTAHLI